MLPIFYERRIEKKPFKCLSKTQVHVKFVPTIQNLQHSRHTFWTQACSCKISCYPVCTHIANSLSVRQPAHQPPGLNCTRELLRVSCNSCSTLMRNCVSPYTASHIGTVGNVRQLARVQHAGRP